MTGGERERKTERGVILADGRYDVDEVNKNGQNSSLLYFWQVDMIFSLSCGSLFWNLSTSFSSSIQSTEYPNHDIKAKLDFIKCRLTHYYSILKLPCQLGL